jgi:competence protein ComEC
MGSPAPVPKLEALDSWLRRVPFLGPATGMWIGSAIEAQLSGRWVAALAIAGTVAALRWSNPKARLVSLFALALGTGALAGQLTHDAARCPKPSDKRQTIAKVLRILPEPDGRISLELMLQAMGDGTKFEALRCRGLLSSGRRPPEAIEGDTVWLPPVDWEPVAHLYNPGNDTAEGLEAREIDRVGSLADGAGILPLSHGNALERAVGRLRREVHRELAGLPASAGREVLQAVLLGERAALSAATRDDFLDSGLRHFLTDGTLYLAAALFLMFMMTRAIIGSIEPLVLFWPAGRVVAAICLPLPLLYCVVTGGWPAAARASLMATLWLTARGLGRGRPSALHLMTVALVVLLGLSPAGSRDPGLWLSASALVFIAAFAAPILRRLGTGSTRGSLREHFAAAVVVAAAIWVATLPILAEENQRLSWVGFPASLAGLPLGLGMSVSGVLFLILASVGSPAAVLPLAASLFCAQRLASLATLIAPFSRWIVKRPSALALVGYFCGLGVVWALRRKRGAISLACLAGAVLVAWTLLQGLKSPFGPAELRLTFLSVGQGDGVVIELPSGETLVLDAGGSPVGSFDPGERVVAPYLWSRGHTRLAVLALSHPHPDHANGLPYLLSRFEVGELWQSGEPCPLTACDELERLSLSRGVPRLHLGAEPFRRSFGPVELTLLWPQAPLGYDPTLGENDNSMVFRLTFGRFTALLPGDIEADAEEGLLSTHADLRADVLKAPHHGSDTSSTQAFVDRVHPRDVVFSVGPRNRFGFPRESVVARYARAGARLERTDRDGAVTFITDGSGEYRVATAAPR